MVSNAHELRPLLATGMTKIDESGVASGIQQIRVLRIVIGVMGALLPSVLFMGDWLFLRGSALPRGSVSAYYYSGMRDFLVASVATIGIFLMTYRLLDRHIENLLSSIAGLAALVVVIMPTKRPPGLGVDATDLQKFFGESLVSNVHLGSAIVFVGCLIVMCFLFGLRESGWLRVVIQVCTGGMVVSLLACLLLMIFVDYWLLVGEAGAVFFFGLAWIIKGAFQ